MSTGIRRLIIEQIELAIENIQRAGSAEQKHHAVHECRKAFKKIRALLRLVRDNVSYYKEENVFFRDLGRQIADLRNAAALVEAIDNLYNQFESKLYKSAFQNLENQLVQHKIDLANHHFKVDHTLAKIRDMLEAKLVDFKTRPLEINDFNELESNIKRVYKRGKQAMSRAQGNRGLHEFHEWRKRAKYLRYQLTVLHRIWPGMLKVLKQELHILTDLIGNDHDLYLLEHISGDFEDPFTDTSEQSLFKALIVHSHATLQKHALLIGEKFYFDSPSTFWARLELYSKNHQQLLIDDALPPLNELEL